MQLLPCTNTYSRTPSLISILGGEKEGWSLLVTHSSFFQGDLAPAYTGRGDEPLGTDCRHDGICRNLGVYSPHCVFEADGAYFRDGPRTHSFCFIYYESVSSVVLPRCMWTICCIMVQSDAKSASGRGVRPAHKTPDINACVYL